MQFDEERIQWHFAVWKWLLANFGGMEALQKRLLVTPACSRFPQGGRNEHEYAESMFEAVKELMGISDWPCRLEPLDDESPADDLIQRHMLEGQWSTHGPAGTFQWSEEGVVIRYSPRKLNDAPGTVATMAHELCHYVLAKAQFDPPNGWEEHELHTDVACSFMGFGIFQSNSAFNYRQWTDGQQNGWSFSRHGYLSESEHAYALALFCVLTGADSSAVLPWLKTNPKAYFKLALQDLAHREEELGKLRNADVMTYTPDPSDSEMSPDGDLRDPGEVPALTIEEVESLVFRDPENEPLWEFFCELAEQQPGEYWHQKEIKALKMLPRRLRDMVLIVRFEILQRTMGLQGAVLLDGPDIVLESEQLLRMTADAFDSVSEKSSESFLRSLLPAIASHLELLETAEAMDQMEDFVSPLDQDETWNTFGYSYLPELRRQVRDFAFELVFPAA